MRDPIMRLLREAVRAEISNAFEVIGHARPREVARLVCALHPSDVQGIGARLAEDALTDIARRELKRRPSKHERAQIALPGIPDALQSHLPPAISVPPPGAQLESLDDEGVIYKPLALATLAERFEALIDAGLQAREQQQARRQYLGASRLGVCCERQLQYECAQAPVDADKGFSGRILRIFERGHRMEDAMVGWLRAAGFMLKTEGKDGQQFGFSVAEGKLQGHCDGVFVAGPEGYAYPALWECKCLGNKSWSDLVKKGLAVSKPIYAAQVAIYQAYLGLHEHPAIFTAVNADSMEIYTELVPFDAALAQKMSDRAVRVIQATQAGDLLPRAFAEASHFECKFCPYAQRCWGGL